jgi:hypothetical protein
VAKQVGFDMQLPEASFYDLAVTWIGLPALLAGLAVFCTVAWLRLKVEASSGLKRLQALALPIIVEIPNPIAIDAEWQPLTGIIQTRTDRLRAVSSLHDRARQRIEAAEYTLDRLLADCAAHLLSAEESMRMQARRAALAEQSPAAVPVTRDSRAA